MYKILKNYSLWFVLFPCLLLVSFYLSWTSLSYKGFMYDVLYDNTKLATFIDLYAPHNRYKKGFELTDREERIRLFETILNNIDISAYQVDTKKPQESMNQVEESLMSIQYHSPQGKAIDYLLRDSEVEHLVFVSQLIGQLKKISGFALMLATILLFFIFIKSIPLPKLSSLLISYAIMLVSILLAIAVIGPLNIFVYLHESFFDGHQWFFYYQESLMTTLMMAPDLFAYFAVIWSILAVWLFIFLSFASVWGLKRFAL